MRVLFTVSNWAGHYFCMVPLGWALQAAGHQVRVACPPEQANAISRAGLTPVPVLEGLDVMRMTRFSVCAEVVMGRRVLPCLPAHPRTGEPLESLDDVDIEQEQALLGEHFTRAAKNSVQRAEELVRAWKPDLICYDLLSDEGPIAGAATRVPSVFCNPGLFGTHETGPFMDLRIFDTSYEMARSGAPGWTREQAQLVLDPSPESVSTPFGEVPRLAMKYVPYNGPGAPLDEPPSSGTRVRIIWGYSATGTFGAQVPALRHAVDAALEAGAEVTLTASPAQVDALGDLSENVRVLRNHPLHLLLEDCDLLVHHGSANALMNAAVAGVPQLALALTDDSVFISQRMAATGAVTALPGLDADAETVGKSVCALLADPAYRRAAGDLRAELAAYPSPARLVTALEELATSGSVDGATTAARSTDPS